MEQAIKNHPEEQGLIIVGHLSSADYIHEHLLKRYADAEVVLLENMSDLHPMLSNNTVIVDSDRSLTAGLEAIMTPIPCHPYQKVTSISDTALKMAVKARRINGDSPIPDSYKTTNRNHRGGKTWR